MSDLIELDALLDLLDNKKDAHIRESERLGLCDGYDNWERAARHQFTAIQLDKVIDEVLNLPRY